MPINIGYTEQRSGNGVIVRAFYDDSVPASSSQPLVNAPNGRDYGNGVIGRGLCLDVTSDQAAEVTIVDPTGTKQTFTVAAGDPAAVSRTAQQMRALGFRTRGDLQNFNVQ